MGYGSYTSSDWSRLKSSRGISDSSDAKEIFRKNHMEDRFNPKFVTVRESCDSDDSPNATPIIIGFDVTGSMGYLAEEIAKNALNKTVTQIYEKQPVSNPHILCAAIGDTCDSAPLQVTQFEADIRIAEQLLDLWLEGRGGDLPEAFNLLWYFADKHTRTDANIKRGAKGFLFTIGDATVHPSISKYDISYVFDDTVKNTLYNKELIENASKKYELFHIVTKARSSETYEEWEKLLPGRVIELKEKDIKYLAEVIISTMQLANGMDKDSVVNQWSGEAAQTVANCIRTISLTLAN